MSNEKNRICPLELADSLDNRFRRWLQNPRKLLAPYLSEGMSVLDIGCGPGFFSVEMARMVGTSGRVVAADLQEGMLQRLRDKITGTELENRIMLVKCDQDKTNVSESFDFILAFFMIHEVPDKNSFFQQMKSVLRENGQFLIVEPRLFHVSRREFALTTALAQNNGFKMYQGPKLAFSWSAILRNA